MSSARDFGAKGDGQTDDSAALHHALQSGAGHLVLPRGDYLITRPLVVPLDKVGRVGVDGQGGTARLIMAGPGPALHLVGTHQRTAQPDHFVESVWQKERLPTVSGLEIVGRHREADGIRVEGAMQPTLHAVLIRRCRHGVHLTGRDRNVLLSACHIYDNSGVGVFFDRVNLHQTIITGSHISYCKQAGIKAVASEIRNIQISGNDIEYNYDLKTPDCADVYFDCREGTVREGTIVGNTIQAKLSPGGANVRLVGVGKDNRNAVGLLAITGNLIGSQETALHLVACRGVVVSGNAIYSGYHRALWAEDAEHVVIGPNSIDHNPEYTGKSTDQVVLRGCRHVTLTGLIVQHSREAEVPADGSIVLDDCTNASVTGCQVIAARGVGVQVKGGSAVRVADCTLRGRPGDATYRAAVQVAGTAGVMIVNNFVSRGTEGDVLLQAGLGTASGNVTV